MSRLVSFLAVALLAAVPAFSQSYPEVDALREAFFAKDVNTLIGYLPVSVRESMDKLPEQQRAEIGHPLLLAEGIRRDGGKVTQPADGTALVLIEQHNHTAEITLEKRISDGQEAVLWLSIHTNGSTGEKFQVSMRFEDGAWRIYEIVPPDARDAIRLDDPHFIESLTGTLGSSNEAIAVR